MIMAYDLYMHAERANVHEHQLFPAVPSDATCEAACSRRKHSDSAVDVHQVVSGRAVRQSPHNWIFIIVFTVHCPANMQVIGVNS